MVVPYSPSHIEMIKEYQKMLNQHTQNYDDESYMNSTYKLSEIYVNMLGNPTTSDEEDIFNKYRILTI